MVAKRSGPTRGIPTVYRGVRMRSRLEARWAAMFDLLHWPWQYEPFDLEGYIPDFSLSFDAGPLVLEIKPEIEIEALRQHVRKILAGGWRRELLVLGARLFDADRIGIIGDDHAIADGGEIEIDHGIAFSCLSCGEVSIRSDALSWRCRACGVDEGAAHVGQLETGWLEAQWVMAGNRVQWRPGT